MSRPLTPRAQRRVDRLYEAAERIADPELIQTKLDGLAPGQKSLLWDLYRKSRVDLTSDEMALRRELIGNLKATADEIEADIYSVFSSLGTDGWTLAQVKRVGRFKSLLDQVANRVEALGGQLNSTLSDGLLDRFKAAWADGAYRLDAVTPESVNLRFGTMADSEIVALLNQEFNGGTFSDRLGIITDDMAQDIKSQLMQSMMSGESWQQAARRIRGEMGTVGAKAVWRSEMIARTELTRAQTTANKILYGQNEDVIEEVIFIAHPGACAICMAKHGKPVSEVGYPVDDTHPNCVCDILAVPKAWEDMANEADASDAPDKGPSRAKWERDNMIASAV